MSRRLGYLDKTIEALNRQRELAEELDSLETRIASLAESKESLQVEIENRQARSRHRVDVVNRTISEHAVDHLHRDLPRELDFRDAEEVTFNFPKDLLAVDGLVVFGASSTVFLKNSFHLALLRSALDDNEFKHPRLLILDNVEDKGMVPERSHAFQRIVTEASASAEVEHQIIMTTSMLAPHLEGTDYVVGGPWDQNNKSLDISAGTFADA